MCDEDTANSVARVVTVGYFEYIVAGKITEPWVAVFWNVYLVYLCDFLEMNVMHI